MRAHATRAVSLSRNVVKTSQRAQITFLAAAVAYYALLSLVPLLAIALVVSAAFGGGWIVEGVLDSLDAVLTPETVALLREALEGGAGRVGASLVGTGILLWSALKVLRALDTAFSAIYGADSFPSLPRSLLNGAVVLAAIPVGIALTAAVPLVVRIFPLGPLARTATVAGGMLGLTVVFLPLYVVFPGRSVHPRDAVPGAFVAALGWTALGSTFSIYIDVAGGVTLYGPIGGFLLLVTLLYFGALVLMLGVVVNATLANDRQLQQAGSRHSPVTRTMSDDGQDADGTGAREPDRGDATAEQRPTDREGASSAAPGEAAGAVDEPEEFDPDNRTPGDADWRREVTDLREELDALRDDVEGRTVDREDVESDLKRYVRRRIRRGHARGWGPYLVLLYGTAMTIGAFYYLEGPWAVLSMTVVWLSTLGLYTLMVLVGFSLHLAGLPGRTRDAIGDWRS